ncbi:MAG TPA: hypothetical protein VN648_06685 [Candidatus Methylomirabilis sp.]|nr:hypothetical protein [Candidatus Methylomirabilis sp.]
MTALLLRAHRPVVYGTAAEAEQMRQRQAALEVRLDMTPEQAAERDREDELVAKCQSLT